MGWIQDLVNPKARQWEDPLLESGLPPYEPRGCQRGISASWYVF
jgi:nitrate reductase alpha subunit